MSIEGLSSFVGDWYPKVSRVPSLPPARPFRVAPLAATEGLLCNAQLRALQDRKIFHCDTVLVTLLRCIVNCTAYPIQALCGPFPQKQGLGLKGLGWGFLTLTERALKE